MKHSVKRKQNKGFTLAELLIVVAIIGVLVAISIPVFAKQKLKAQEAVDKANRKHRRLLIRLIFVPPMQK